MTTHVETRHAIHPDHAKGMDTETLRRHFLAEGLFATAEEKELQRQWDALPADRQPVRGH